MNERANITYTGVADRNARLAFEQVSREIIALKKGLANVGAPATTTAEVTSEAVTASSVSGSVASRSVFKRSDGLAVMTVGFTATLGGSGGYASFLTLDDAAPLTDMAAAVSYFSAPPASGHVTCTILTNGMVMIGTVGTGGAFDCVATAVWNWR